MAYVNGFLDDLEGNGSSNDNTDNTDNNDTSDNTGDDSTGQDDTTQDDTTQDDTNQDEQPSDTPWIEDDEYASDCKIKMPEWPGDNRKFFALHKCQCLSDA